MTTIDLDTLFPDSITISSLTASIDVDVSVEGGSATVTVDGCEIEDYECEGVHVDVDDDDIAAFVVGYLDEASYGRGVTLEALEAMIVAIRRVAHEDHRVGPDPDGDGEE